MTNVFGSAKKVSMRNRLFQIGVETLQEHGWKVEKVPRSGKSSVRRITKGNESQVVSIRTTQDTYLAFPRNAEDSAWVTLSDVDSVVAVSVDDRDSPKFALVHLIDGDDLRERFDRAYDARRAAGHSIPIGRGVWVPLYLPDATDPPAHVGGGAGLDNPPIARVPLQPQEPPSSEEPQEVEEVEDEDDVDEVDVGTATDPKAADGEPAPLTIGEAKRRLAFSLGVDASSIKITIEA